MTTTREPEAALPRSEITVSLILALVTAIAGLATAFTVAPPGNRGRLRLPVLDRSAAETGRSSTSGGSRQEAPVSSRETPGYVPFSADAPSAPSLAPPVFGLRLPDPSPAPASPAPPQSAATAPQGHPSRAPPRPPPAPPGAVAGGVPSVVSPNGGLVQPPRAPGASAAGVRPLVRPVNLSQAWQSVGPAVGIVRTHQADYLGVALAPDGLFVTSRAAVEKPEPTVTFGRGPIKAKVVLVNQRLDLVVLRLAEPPPAMLSLASPGSFSRGSTLAYAVTAEVVERFAEARVVGLVGKDGLELVHYSGLTHDTSRGSPMVTSNGDLAGIVVGRGWNLLGGAFSLAASPASLRGLLADAAASAENSRPPRHFHVTQVSQELQATGRSLILDCVTAPQVDRSAPPLTIVPAVRIGPLYLGMSLEEASAGLVQDSVEPLGISILLHLYNDRKMALVGLAGKVVAAATQDPHYGSVNGVGAGMMLEHLPLERVVPNVTIVHDPLTGDRVATGEGLEIVADSSGRIREVRVLPVPAP